jgi:hypothetical protein
MPIERKPTTFTTKARSSTIDESIDVAVSTIAICSVHVF